MSKWARIKERLDALQPYTVVVTFILLLVLAVAMILNSPTEQLFIHIASVL